MMTMKENFLFKLQLEIPVNLMELVFFSPPQVKRLRDLEKEKDALCSGLEILEKARLWYLQRLEENRARQDNTKSKSGVGSCQEGAAEV